jgi:hypothetical protein
LAFGVWRSAFGVRRSAFGVRRSAFGDVRGVSHKSHRSYKSYPSLLLFPLGTAAKKWQKYPPLDHDGLN